MGVRGHQPGTLGTGLILSRDVPGPAREAKKTVTTATGRRCRMVLELSDDEETHDPAPVFGGDSGKPLGEPWVEDFQQAIRTIARSDCGFGTLAGFWTPDPPIRHAERLILAEGAALAPDGIR